MDKTFFGTTSNDVEFETATENASFQLAELQLALNCGGAGEVVFG